MAGQNYHKTLRGTTFYYVCRVPVDLQDHFPSKKICKSLKTNSKKDANILVAGIESETRGLFMKLRSRSLDEVTKKKMLADYMQVALTRKEAEIHGKVFGTGIEIQKANAFAAYLEHLGSADVMEGYTEFYGDSTPFQEQLGNAAANTEAISKRGLMAGGNEFSIKEVAELEQKFKVKLTGADSKYLQKQVLSYDVQLAQAEQEARLNADWAKLDGLRGKLDRELQSIKPQYFLKNVCTSYLKSFETDPEKIKIQLNSWRAVKRQVAFILITLGNPELVDFNTKRAKDKLQVALSKRRKSNGEPLSAKDSSEYLKRLSAIVKFTIDEYELDVTNKIMGTYKTTGSVKDRDSYSHKDVKRLENALCTVPIVAGRFPVPRPDRFWIILIALLHGFRLSSIVNLCLRHIVEDEDTNLVCINLRDDSKLLHTKTENMKILCPVHPALIKIGFLNWIERRNLSANDKLFEDTPTSFGAWWNGLNSTSGWNYDHVTQDDKKTFHSFRHYFRVLMDELVTSEKIINEMMGHARDTSGGTGRKHYAERTQAARMARTQQQTMEEGRILNNDLNFDRLAGRAMELFFPE